MVYIISPSLPLVLSFFNKTSFHDVRIRNLSNIDGNLVICLIISSLNYNKANRLF